MPSRRPLSARRISPRVMRMGLWTKLFSPRQRRPPAWAIAAGWHDGERFDAFVAAVIDALDAAGTRATAAQVRSGRLFVEAKGQLHEWRLERVLERCAEHEIAAWPGLLEARIPGAKTGRAPKAAPPAEGAATVAAPAPVTLNQLQRRLRIQLAAPIHALLDPGSLVVWPLADGLRAILVEDLQGSEQNVPPGAIAAWSSTREALFELALTQAGGHASIGLEQGELSDDGRAMAGWFSTPSNYAGALLLFVMRRQETPCIVGVPNWCNFIIRDADPTLDSATVAWLARFTAERCEGSARPCTPHIYWYHAGTYARITLAGDGPEARVTAPAELVQRLAGR